MLKKVKLDSGTSVWINWFSENSVLLKHLMLSIVNLAKILNLTKLGFIAESPISSISESMESPATDVAPFCSFGWSRRSCFVVVFWKFVMPLT